MSLVEQRQGPPMIMDEIPRTYYLGRGFLTDQEAYPENPFYRAPRYRGGDPNLGNTAGMLAGGFRPASYGAIRGGQTPYRFGPYLPYRGEERKEEETPFIPIPLQQAAVGRDQQPAQGPNTPIRYYPGMGYGPYGPGNGGMQPMPIRQALVPPMGFQNKKFVS